MITTKDFINKNHEEPLWLIHNSDFSGDVRVCFRVLYGEDDEVVVDGKCLLRGVVEPWQMRTFLPNEIWGRAVALANRVWASNKMVQAAEDLL